MANPSDHQPDWATRRPVGTGHVVGFRTTQGADVWLGVPYAEPPVGTFRWRAPRPHQGWQGDRLAVAPAAPACQPPSFGVETEDRYIGQEDCLYLNIWAPSRPSLEPRPVIVWIHGGSNMRGQAHSYDARHLTVSQDVVVVSVTYRLGLFGWFRHPALRTGADPADASGNYGTLDLICALRWVSEHIAAFGGDPGKVTIAGNSAGGWNVFSLLTSPLAEGLFHRAVVQSGAVLTLPPSLGENLVDAASPGSPRSSGELLLQLLIDDGLAADRQDALRQLEGWDAARTADYLRSKDSRELMWAIEDPTSRRVAHPPLAMAPIMFADGYVLPKDGILSALREGAFSRVPVLLGATRDEYRILLFIFGRTLSFLEHHEDDGFTVLDPPRFYLAGDYLSQIMQIEGVFGPARAICAHQPGHVFCYRFDWDALDPADWLGDVRLGAAHGLEVYFVFGHLDLGAEFFHHRLISGAALESFSELSARIMSYWGAFARDGTPGRGEAGVLPHWPPYDPDGATMVLGRGATADVACVTMAGTRDDLIGRLATDERFPDPASRHLFIDELIAGTDLGLGFTTGHSFTPEDHVRLRAAVGEGKLIR